MVTSVMAVTGDGGRWNAMIVWSSPAGWPHLVPPQGPGWST